MGRFIMPLKKFESEIEYDVVVVGTGIAGLYTSLLLPSHLKVALISKYTLEENNSNLAQGGIAVTLEQSGIASHIKDTLVAGNHFNNPRAVEVLVNEGKQHIDKLCEIGVFFDRDENGKLLVTREGGHHERRVLHVLDATGKEIIRALGDYIRSLSNVTLMTETMMVDLLSNDNQVCGISVITPTCKQLIKAPIVIMATGGLGHVYPHTTNSIAVTGDGIAAAVRAGVQTMDMEFIQFHPTAFYQEKSDKRFLISEAVRGEGAILRNQKGLAFMQSKHPLKDLAPRDIVARAILDEIRNSTMEYVFLDVTGLETDYVKMRFPMIYKTCLEKGIDITKDYVPVRPVEHYLMGGIAVDLEGRTSMKGLYAVGETACNRVHGANRLASNSLLEGLVFGARVAQAVSLEKSLIQGTVLDQKTNNHPLYDDEALVLKGKLQTLLVDHAFIYRNKEDLENSLKEVQDLCKEYQESVAVSTLGVITLNLLTCALQIFTASASRKSSMGAHQLLKEN